MSRSLSILLPVLLVLFPVQASALPLTIEFSEAEIQAEVATLFPMRQQFPFVNAEFSNPRVRIINGSDRIRLALDVHARFAGELDARGQVEIEGGIGYDRNLGEFHLLRPAVTGLAFDRLPPEAVELVRLMANAVAEQYLPGIPVYRLDARDFREGLMRRSLRDVRVGEGKVVVELGW